ncbi:MAG: sulfate ABC transporter substrate-binding protein [Burkholderiales bacterium]|nr:sulfate ABC transporter substrate-binding protein [Burkholderiales bacterium]
MLWLAVAAPVAPLAWAQSTLVNVSFDVMRDFYADVNTAFARAWRERAGTDVTIQMSHGGSKSQARAVADGFEADVITMNEAVDIDLLAQRGALVPAHWSARLPERSAPFTSVTVFVVRKGNPKAVRDWSDLVRPDVQVLVPSARTSGNGRYAYLTAWQYAARQSAAAREADPAAAAERFVTALFRNVPALDSDGPVANLSFMRRGLGDVLVTFENEAQLIAKEYGRGNFEVVYPSLSVVVELPVAVVDKVAARRGTRELAQAYVDFLYSAQGQDIAARNHLRPRSAGVLRQYVAQFPPIVSFTVDESFGGWQRVQKAHFDDGGIYDRVLAAAGK